MRLPPVTKPRPTLLLPHKSAGPQTEAEGEQGGGAAETEVPHGQEIDHVIRNMVEQHEPVGEPAREIDPQIAAMHGNTRLDRRLHGKAAPRESKLSRKNLRFKQC